MFERYIGIRRKHLEMAIKHDEAGMLSDVLVTNPNHKRIIIPATYWGFYNEAARNYNSASQVGESNPSINEAKPLPLLPRLTD